MRWILGLFLLGAPWLMPATPAGEAVPPAQEPWCQVPAWLAEPIADLPVPVVADGPYQAVRAELPDLLLPGDRLVGLGDPREVLLAIARQPLEVDEVPVVVERDGQRLTVVEDRDHLVRHLQALRWTAAGAQRLADLGFSGSPASLDRIPGRVLAHLLADPKAPGTARLVATWQAVESGGELPPAGAPVADPFLARCETLWRRFAGEKDLSALWTWGIEPEFAALYLPYPGTQGNLGLGLVGSDVEFSEAVQDALGVPPDASLTQRREEAGHQTSKTDEVPTRTYLNQIKAAILDPKNHGGWPYRSYVIWEQEGRLTTLAWLRRQREEPGPDRGLYGLAMVCPLLMENAGDELRAVITDLRQTSPAFAGIAREFLRHAITMHPAGQPALDGLPPDPRPVLALHPLYALLATRSNATPNWFLEETDLRHGVPGYWRSHPEEVAQALAPWWDLRRGPQKDLEQAILNELNNRVVWPMAIEPAGGDPAALGEALDQMRHLAGRGMPAFMLDTVGTAFAQAGDFPAAVRYQRGAVTGDKKVDFARRLAQFQEKKPYHEGTPIPPEGLRSDQERGANGVVVAAGQRIIATGQRTGWWKTFSATGTLLREDYYARNQMRGPSRRYHPNGTLAESGLQHGDQRLGRWRSYDAAGHLIGETWYRGTAKAQPAGWTTTWDPRGARVEAGTWIEGNREGFWQTWRPDGTPASAGRYEEGAQMGLWRTWNEAGVPTDRTAAGKAIDF